MTSSEIAWSSPAYQADPTRSDEIAEGLETAYRIKAAAPKHNPSLAGLQDYNAGSRRVWLEYFGGVS